MAIPRKLPGLKNFVQGTWRRAQDELIAHVMESETRWAAVQAVLVTTVSAAPFKKKLKAATWVEGEPVFKGEKTFPLTADLSAEAQYGMLAVASHMAWAEALHPGKQSMCNPALWWNRGDLQVAQDEDEPEVDRDVVRQLFRLAQRGAPQAAPRRGHRHPADVPLQCRPPPGVAPGWKPPLQRVADEIVREHVLVGSARTHVCQLLECDHEALGELRTAATLGDEWTRHLVSTAQEDPLPESGVPLAWCYPERRHGRKR